MSGEGNIRWIGTDLLPVCAERSRTGPGAWDGVGREVPSSAGVGYGEQGQDDQSFVSVQADVRGAAEDGFEGATDRSCG
jgi:hypothetical protein